jgi:hypothetical protein
VLSRNRPVDDVNRYFKFVSDSVSQTYPYKDQANPSQSSNITIHQYNTHNQLNHAAVMLFFQIQAFVAFTASGREKTSVAQLTCIDLGCISGSS